MSAKQPEGLADKVSYLRDVDILRDLAPAEVEEMGKRAPMQRVPAGTIFYSPEQADEKQSSASSGEI
jgi:CRP/FNR family cyclic AMP-dependent transcriptional regulator